MKKVLFIYAVLISLGASAQERKWSHLYIPNLNCLKTTEAGEDEIYLLVTFKTSYGAVGTVRLKAPDENKHWNMNDGNRNISNRNLDAQYGFMLAEGESIDFVCTIMEVDGGTPEKYLEIGSAILANAPQEEPLVATATVILGALAEIAAFLKIKDTDDWIGSIQYHVSRNNGQISSRSVGVYNPNSNQNGTNAKLTSATGHVFSFAGDGSSYIVTSEVK